MLIRDRLYRTYSDKLEDVRLLYDAGLEKFVTHKRYLNLRQKYLEMIASLPNRKLDARVNSLLQEIKEYPTPISICDIQFNTLLEERNKLMKAKERSPRKEKKKQKKQKR